MCHLFLRCLLFAAVLTMIAASKTEAEELPRHYMHADTGHVDIDDIEYKTADELMKAVATLPVGSKLQLNTGCLGLRVIDTTPSIKVKDFERFCAEHGVKLHVSSGLHF